MKTRIGLLYIVFAVCMGLLASCADDWEKPSGNGHIEEGIPVEVSLKLEVSRPNVVSRAAGNDYMVSAMYVLVFNADGTEDNTQLFTVNSSSEQVVSISGLHMNSGKGKRFYIVANPNAFGTDVVDRLVQLTTEQELLDLTARLGAEASTNIERNFFLMTGKMEPADGSGTIDVDENGRVVNGSTIKLERVDAWITFQVKGEPADKRHTDFSFVPDRIWVEQIPQGTYLFPKDKDYGEVVTDPKPYHSMSEDNVNLVFNPKDDDGNYLCHFYIAENRQEPTVRITQNETGYDAAENLYALREKRAKGDNVSNPSKPGQEYEPEADFKYAPQNATYVVIHGTLSYTDPPGSSTNDTNITKFVNADVYYTVHLGETGTAGDADNVDKVNNYDTRRNTHYTYTVTVTGIESMKVEVKADSEKRPGVEGDVIIAGGDVKTMDSHFGRTHFTLKRGDLKLGLSWAISTPFQKGMKVFVETDHTDDYGNVIPEEEFTAEGLKKLQTDLTLNDYKWVQFVINKEARKSNNQFVPSNDYAKYPGWEAYNDGEQEEFEPAPAFGGAGWYHRGNGQYYSRNVTLYDVNQLINHLYVEAHNPNSTLFDGTGDDATVAITAFVDEYVYTYDPTKTYYKAPGALGADDPNLLLWKKVVNGTNRMLHLCTSKEIYSPDGNTSLAESVVTFSQHPIYTFYDATHDGVTTAWGTESNSETGPLNPLSNTLSKTETNTAENGRQNTLNILPRSGVLSWTDVIDMNVDAGNADIPDGKQLNSNYNNVWYATLLRNRDLNGNNIVEADEIRWYLASIDQLTDLWIGQWSLNQSSWLYQKQGGTAWHVISSTYKGNSSENPYLIWAEEGASIGGYNEDGFDAIKGDNAREYDYRCIRNLGISLNSITQTPQDYVTVLPDGQYNGHQEKRIDVSMMEYNSIRTADISGIQGNHHEREFDNRPYKQLAVIARDANPAYGIYPSGGNSVIYGAEDYQNGERLGWPCPSGYRIPNQRELMLLYTTFPDLFTTDAYNGEGFGYIIAKTSYSFSSDRPGFAFATKNQNFILLSSNDNKGKVRCVRDITVQIPFRP